MNHSKHLLGYSERGTSGPTLLFFGGIHGNEPAGVKALKAVFAQLEAAEMSFTGRMYGILGNLSALTLKIRYVEEDLNRIWLPNRMPIANETMVPTSVDAGEMCELYSLIQEILKTAPKPIYCIDLHTTSGVTMPFIVVNDSLLNRRFTQNYPLPIILGIEEYLPGALLSYINELGYVALGFESGQHDAPEAILNAKNFIWYTLGITGFLVLEPSLMAYYKRVLVPKERLL
ncbi:MAG: succinylglutamate desuccinylase/aspartoacylase family protein, partial [Bacteroidota bacterium]